MFLLDIPLGMYLSVEENVTYQSHSVGMQPVCYKGRIPTACRILEMLGSTERESLTGYFFNHFWNEKYFIWVLQPNIITTINIKKIHFITFYISKMCILAKKLYLSQIMR